MAKPNELAANSSAIACTLGGISIQALLEFLKDNKTAVIAGAASGTWLGPIGVVAGALAGIGANRLSTWLDKRKETRDALKHFLTNHDIALVQARAVEQLLLKYAATCESDMVRKPYAAMIRELAGAAGSWWLHEVNNPDRVELEKLRDEAIVGGLTNYLEYGNTSVLSERTWLELVGRAAVGMPCDPRLEGPIIDDLADYLAKEYPAALVEGLKHDFRTDGKAYAAVSLRYYASLLDEVKESGTDIKEVKDVLAKMPLLLGSLEQTAKALQGLREGLRQDLREIVTECLPSIQGMLQEQTAKLQAHVSAAVKDGVCEVKAELGEVKAALTINPERIRARLIEVSERTRKRERDEANGRDDRSKRLLAADAAHESRLRRVDDIVAYIEELESGTMRSEVLTDLLSIMESEGANAAIAYMDSKRELLLKRSDALNSDTRRMHEPMLAVARFLQMRGDLTEAYSIYREISERLPPTKELRMGLLHLLVAMTEDEEVRGTVNRRRELLEEAHEIAKEHWRCAEASRAAKFILSTVEIRLGELLMDQGALEQAYPLLDRALQMRRTLIEDAADKEALRSLRTGYDRMKNLYIHKGKMSKANECAKHELRILVKLNEMGVGTRREWADAALLTGQHLLRQQNFSGALECFEDAHKFAIAWVGAEDMNVEAHRFLAMSHERLGSLSCEMENFTRALREFEAQKAVSERVMQMDKASSLAKHDLSIAYGRLGQLARSQKEYAKAKQLLSESLKLRISLVQEDSGNAGALRDLCVAFEAIAMLCLDEKLWEEALQRFNDLHGLSSDAANVHWTYPPLVQLVADSIQRVIELERFLKREFDSSSLRAHINLAMERIIRLQEVGSLSTGMVLRYGKLATLVGSIRN